MHLGMSGRCAALLLAVAAAMSGTHARAAETSYVELNGQRFGVEIAQTDATRATGLMFRQFMMPDHGMLFVFPDTQMRAFWMKNTKIALDMLFFDGQRHLVSIQHDVPPCVADPCPSYASTGPARYVLELNAGQARKLGAKAGDVLQIHP